jgi:hypothetical integral membrane protein (TIGR02206 family)
VGSCLSPTAHVSILLTVLAVAGTLSALLRYRPTWGRTVRLSLGTFLATNELLWYAYRFHEEGFRFPEGLPLQLCDVTLWLTVVTAVKLKLPVYEIAYFSGIGGSGMALLTPDLWAPFLSYPTVYFFLSHGFVVITLIALTFGGLVQPRHGSVWRTFAILNIYTAGVGVFDAIFTTNYMYLCQKPVNPSLLDYFGPWPLYILIEEAFALAVFWLLWLPVRMLTPPSQ